MEMRDKREISHEEFEHVWNSIPCTMCNNPSTFWFDGDSYCWEHIKESGLIERIEAAKIRFFLKDPIVKMPLEGK